MAKDASREQQPSNAVLAVRVTSEQRAQLARDAASAGMPVSDYVRQRLFGTTSPANGRYDALSQEVDTLRTALKLAGLDNAIRDARAMLERRED